jgi:mono/diheme cytochrome c family protein
MRGRWTRRWLKVAAYGAALLVLLLAVGVTLTVGWRPVVGPKARPLTGRRFEPSAARLARGEYLANSVTGCLACHTALDPKDPARSYAAAKRRGGGGPMENDGMPWLIAPNITPDRETGAGDWSDDALARAIREGVGHDGRALFPVMPYGGYRHMSDEDLASVIVYLRTLEPVRNPLPESDIPFPLSRLINNAPQPLAAPVPEPDRSNQVKYGEYLVRIGDCAGCHTPRDERGQEIAGLAYGGGTPFAGGKVVSANITPDASGISYYDEALFLGAMKEGHVSARRLSPAMPWWMYSRMTDADLKAMFAYLRTLPPADHRVDNTEPPTHCKLCKQKHGAGERN